MKAMRIIYILLMLVMVYSPVDAGNRTARKTMKELTDPNSPSYVPHPYPKTRAEIIENIRYYYIDLSANLKSAYVGGVPLYKKITTELFSSNSRYRFGKIVKVKNRSEEFSDNYSWLIYVLDEEGDAFMRIKQRASGLAMGCSIFNKDNLAKLTEKRKLAQKKRFKMLEEEDVKQFLSDALGTVIDDSKIKKMERLGARCKLSRYHYPLWEITMKDNTVYYYSELIDMVYSVEKKNPWKKGEFGRRWIRHREFDNKWYIPDSINEELIFLTPMPSKNKSK